MQWSNPVSEEIRRRILLSIWAYAYEFEAISLVDDFTYDQEALKVNLDLNTSYEGRNNSEIDKWFKENYNASSGMWIRNHPNLKRIKELYMYHLEKKIKLEEEEKVKMTPHLKLITGGGDTPQKTGVWLKDLEIGTVFFVSNAKELRDFQLQLFRKEGQEGTHQNVVCIRSPLLPKELYVDPIRFSNMFNLHHTVGVMAFPTEPIKEEQENEQGHWVTPPEGEAKKDLDKPD